MLRRRDFTVKGKGTRERRETLKRRTVERPAPPKCIIHRNTVDFVYSSDDIAFRSASFCSLARPRYFLGRLFINFPMNSCGAGRLCCFCYTSFKIYLLDEYTAATPNQTSIRTPELYVRPTEQRNCVTLFR